MEIVQLSSLLTSLWLTKRFERARGWFLHPSPRFCVLPFRQTHIYAQQHQRCCGAPEKNLWPLMIFRLFTVGAIFHPFLDSPPPHSLTRTHHTHPVLSIARPAPPENMSSSTEPIKRRDIKAGNSVDDLRRRRSSMAVSLRKAKKEQGQAKRRNTARPSSTPTASSTDGSTAPGAPTKAAAQRPVTAADVPTLAQALGAPSGTSPVSWVVRFLKIWLSVHPTFFFTFFARFFGAESARNF